MVYHFASPGTRISRERDNHTIAQTNRVRILFFFLFFFYFLIATRAAARLFRKFPKEPEHTPGTWSFEMALLLANLRHADEKEGNHVNRTKLKRSCFCRPVYTFPSVYWELFCWRHETINCELLLSPPSRWLLRFFNTRTKKEDIHSFTYINTYVHHSAKYNSHKLKHARVFRTRRDPRGKLKIIAE